MDFSVPKPTVAMIFTRLLVKDTSHGLNQTWNIVI